MTLTRRLFVTSAAASGLAATLPARVWASASLQLGNLRIDTLSDGNLVFPASFAYSLMPADELAPILQRYGKTDPVIRPDCNVTLLRDGTNTVLFDTGSGPAFQPTVGKLTEALDELGVGVDDVTHVVFTHGHPDHLWGIIDDFDDPLFANARHMMGRIEFDYWRDPETARSIPESRASFAAGAKRRLDQLAEQFTFFEDGAEILPGIAATATFGHTPGHMAFEIRAGSDSVMVLGDAVTNADVSFERPDWPYGSDQDTAAAAATRARLFDRLSAEQMRFVGYHLPFPGIGRAETRAAGGYRFVADA
jgi:glyoxylase-like metal-dependent hydrolase (beta-lactamase superfamily II)